MEVGGTLSGAIQDTSNLDIGDYMDIVTTYKCRFCSFTSAVPQGISEHVKQIHIQQPIQRKPETIQINNKNVPIDTTLTVDMETGCVQIQPIMSSENDSNNVKVISEQSAITGTYENVLENFDELTSNGASCTDDLSASNTANLQDNVTLVRVGDEHIINFTSQEKNNETTAFDVVSVNDSSSPGNEKIDMQMVVKSDSFETNGELITDGSTQTNDNQTGFTLACLEVQPYQSPTSPETKPAITKELFLCGQCSIGYNTIEDCKTHMVEEHNIQIEDTTDSNIKISVGTQVENSGKKPGRKRKSEITQDESEVIVQPLSDSDWEEDKEEFYIGSRSRRKIRRPKALKENYYLPKRKKTESYSDKTTPSRQKQLPPVMEKFEEKCHVVGCYAKFKTKESLDIHAKCHVENTTSFICPDCLQIFPNWRVIRFHLWKLHKIDTDLLQCDICHEFRTDGISKLMIHKEIHSVEKPYTCDVCGKGFRQYSQMKNHQLIHDSDDPSDTKTKGKKQCDICKRLFANHKCLLKHVEGVHSKIKPYECTYCGYTSSRKAMLQLHERTHTKEKPFKCDVCSFATGDHNSLRRHTMRHTGRRPYRCNYCNYTCIQSISIKMHMKNKHPNAAGVFCCNECTFRTVNEQYFLNHVEDHKNGLVIEKETTVQSTIQIMHENGIQLQDIIEIQEKERLNQIKNPLQMQVQTLESGETQISAEDFAKISHYEDLGTSNISSGQLITYALNAIAQNSSSDTECSSIQIVNGIQISVMSAPPKDGVTNHTITFHVPSQDNFQNTDNQVILEQVNQMNEVQTLMFDDVSETVEDVVNSNDQVILTSEGEMINLVPTATIDDLAQISCIVKDSIIFENAVNPGCSLNDASSQS